MPLPRQNSGVQNLQDPCHRVLVRTPCNTKCNYILVSNSCLGDMPMLDFYGSVYCSFDITNIVY